MFAVIFEVEPKPERFQEYLDLAKALRPELERIDGFIVIDRFASKHREGRLLSLSSWRNEKALIRWRTHAGHHAAQERGRFEIFSDYRLRVGEVTADSHLPKDAVRQERFDETEIAPAKIATVTEVVMNANDPATRPDLLASRLGLDLDGKGVVEHELYESIYHPGKSVLLVSWRDADAAQLWTPAKPDSAEAIRHRHVRIIRDYGMFERREAPQYYAAVERPAARRAERKRTAAG
jgi:heme-degrading monooxygenase HmoA